jgi:hypothetical protein
MNKPQLIEALKDVPDDVEIWMEVLQDEEHSACVFGKVGMVSKVRDSEKYKYVVLQELIDRGGVKDD